MDSHRAEQLFEPAAEAEAGPRETFDERRDHILRTATRVFAQLGYEKASMRVIAQASDVSLAGLYHYYKSKEEILFVMQFRVFSSLLDNLREALQGVESPEARLRIMVHEHVTYFASHMAELKVCSHELDSLGGDAYDETREIRRQYYAIARSIIGDIVDADPRPFPVDLHVATMSLFGTLNWLYRWCDPRQGALPRNIATQISNQFLHGAIPVRVAAADDDAAAPTP